MYIRHIDFKGRLPGFLQMAEKKAEIKAVLCEGKYIPFYEQDGYYLFEIEITMRRLYQNIICPFHYSETT